MGAKNGLDLILITAGVLVLLPLVMPWWKWLVGYVVCFFVPAIGYFIYLQYERSQPTWNDSAGDGLAIAFILFFLLSVLATICLRLIFQFSWMYYKRLK